MVRAWFGMCWQGNPFVIGVEVLYEESHVTHEQIVKGTLVMRFAPEELAEHFANIADGMEVFYQHYDRSYMMDQDHADPSETPVIWHQTVLDVKVSRKTFKI